MTHLSGISAAFSAKPGSANGAIGAADGLGAGGPLQGVRILLVEDEVLIAFDIAHALEAAGAEVSYARTLNRAMRLVADGRFDLAVLDVTLGPDTTCRPVADRLRSANTPYLVHSGDLDRQGEVIAQLAAPVLSKPAAPEAVAKALERLLSDVGRTRH